jgi:hypothetical protein
MQQDGFFGLGVLSDGGQGGRTEREAGGFEESAA